MTSCIYTIRHIESGRCYVGSTRSFARRRYQHERLLTRGKHHSPRLQRAWTKYGEAAFEFVVIEKCVVEELLEREQHWIDTLDSCFNNAKVAGSRAGVKYTPEQSARLSAAMKGRVVSAETRAKMSASQKLRSPDTWAGRPHTDETKRLLSEIRKGVPSKLRGVKRDPAIVAKVSAAQKGVPREWQRGRKHSPETIAKMRETALKNRENRARASNTRWAAQREAGQ